MQTGQSDGKVHLFCATIVHAKSAAGTSFTKVPIPIEFVKDYGAANSFLDEAGIRQLMDWRPEFHNAVLEGDGWVFQNGTFTVDPATQIVRMYTVSEVGKMSKSRYNVINPDDVVAQYGADCFRMYEMFLGPIEQAKPWDTKGIDGVYKFLRRFWGLFFNKKGEFFVSEDAPSREEWKILHQAIKRVTDDIERFSFNTCVSAFMIATNELQRLGCNKRAVLREMILLLAPFAPFVTEELWRKLGGQGSVHLGVYPEYNPAYLEEDMIEYPVSVNGKRRASVEFPATSGQQELQEAVLKLEVVRKWIEGKQVQRVVVVPKRMINIVVEG
jgi:leucyl-tRNA synthetase